MSALLGTAQGVRRRPCDVIRVASVPSGHVYVHHLADPDGEDGVLRLPDPVPTDRMVGPGKWWPPAMLTESWLRAHHQDFDVFHVQFGFDALSTSQLQRLVNVLADLGKPLVYTVHDLRNPHHEDRTAHDEHLDVLVPAADALLTITAGAATEVQRRWGSRPVVVPHPHVVEPDRMRQPRCADRSTFFVGVHVKSLRAAMAPLPVLRVLADVVPSLPGARLQVNVHHDVFDGDGLRHDPELVGFLRAARDKDELRIAVHDCFSDDELWDYLQGLDVSVLPYRHGTHSGWLEACYDLGTTVIVPSCGYIAEQRPCLTYGHDDADFDGASLAAAVSTAYVQRPHWQADVSQRLAERRHIATVHRDLYTRLLA